MKKTTTAKEIYSAPAITTGRIAIVMVETREQWGKLHGDYSFEITYQVTICEQMVFAGTHSDCNSYVRGYEKAKQELKV